MVHDSRARTNWRQRVIRGELIAQRRNCSVLLVTMTTAVDLVQPHSQNAALARRAKHMVHMASQGLCKVPHHNSSRPRELTLSDHSEMLPEAINTRLPRWRR